MKPFTLSFAVVVALWGMGQLHAEIIDYDTTIDYADESLSVIEGADPPTTVDILDGSMETLRVYDGSIVNVHGGRISNANAYDTSTVSLSGESQVFIVYAVDDSTVRISGGQVEANLYALDSSSVDIAGGVVLGNLLTIGTAGHRVTISGGGVGFLAVGGTDVVDISGGTIGTCAPAGSSRVDISGGLFLQDLVAYSSSTVNISGGVFDDVVRARDSGNVNIVGGTIRAIESGSGFGLQSSVIIVRGTGFNYPYGAIPDSSGNLTGILANGDPIDAPFEIRSHASIVLVPEPSAAALFGVGALAFFGCRLRRRRPSASSQYRATRHPRPRAAYRLREWSSATP